MNWLYAMSQGGAAAAGAGAEIADQQLKEDAEARAADRKLDLAQRIAAAEELIKNRAIERFSAVVKTKAGEAVPMEAASVNDTGLTAGSAKAIGLQDGIQGDAGTVKSIIQKARDTLANPNATPEQKENATGMLGQLEKQVKAQGDVNAKEVEGKTRPRTLAEAGKAALNDTLMNDPAAYMAGKGMLYDKSDIEQQRAEAREKLEDKKIEARRESDDRRADQREQQMEFSNQRAQENHERMMERLQAQADRAEKSQNRQMELAFAVDLRTQIKSIDTAIQNLEKSKKGKFSEEIAEIDANIADQQESRKQLIEMQADYFRDSNVKVPEPRTKKEEPTPGGAGAASNDPFGLRKK